MMTLPDTRLTRSYRQASHRPQPLALSWPGLANRFASITLSEMDGVALLNRTDTKYVLTERQLYQALSALTADYRILQVDGVRLNHYRTLYFDTPNFALYMRHHAGALNRYKVRSRTYVDSQLAFLEVKHKVNDSRTIKTRLQTPSLLTELASEANHFLQANYPNNPDLLEAKLWNEFQRITLVSKKHPERLTIDLNLQFSRNKYTTVTLPGVVVAEVKQTGINRASNFIRQMRAMGIRSTGFSKYCVGVSLLYQNVKHNNFKPKLLLLKKLMHKGKNYVH